MKINKKHILLLLMLTIIFILSTGFSTAYEVTNETTSVTSNHTISKDVVTKDLQKVNEISKNNTVKTEAVYVNSTANSNNNGQTKSKATTLTTALNNENNSVIYLTTNSNSDTYKFDSTITIESYDTQRNITIIGENGKTIIFDGQNKSGIFNVYYSTLTLKNIHVINIKSYTGAIYSYNSNIILDNSTIEYNKPSINAPLIEAYESNITINNSNIYNNTIKGTEGLISSSSNTIQIINSNIRNNYINGYSSIVSINDKMTIKNSSFINNTSLKYSSSIYSKNSELTIIDSDFSNNTGVNGGVLFLQETDSLITNSQFNNNYANKLGGAIVQLGNTTITINQCKFNYNTALYDGGSVYSVQSKVNISSTYFTQNKARNGGALYLGNNVNNIKFTINKNVFYENEAIENGDMIWSNYNITLNDNSFISTSNNIWVYLEKNHKININNNWWSTNSPNFNVITNNYVPKTWRILTTTYKTNGNKITITTSINSLSDLTNTTNNIHSRTIKYSSDYGTFNKTTDYISSTVTNTYVGNSSNITIKVDNEKISLNEKIEPYLSLNNISTSLGGKVTFNITSNSVISEKISLKFNNVTLTATLSKGVKLLQYTIPNTWKSNNYTTILTLNENDIFQSKTVIGYINIKDSNLNISINPINSSDLKVLTSKLPSSYNLRNQSLVTSVKVQGGSGSCWVFSSLASLESVLLKKTGINYDLSENNIKNVLKKNSILGDSSSESNTGNNDLEPISFLVGWYGPTLEEYDTYEATSIISPLLNSSFHIQDVYIIPERKNTSDNELIKQAIYNYGAVSTGIYLSGTNSYTTNHEINHGVTIVGWDDNYSKTNFSPNAPGDGAFIIKNSWGTRSGDNGYHYVSYYDTTIGSLCNVNDSMNEQYNYVVLMENNDNYTNIYQYDTIVNALETESSFVAYKNVYTATKDENIASIGSYFMQKSDYVVEIEVNGNMVYSQNGTVTLPGYRTIRLNNFVQLNKDDEFIVTLKINRSNEGHQYIIVQYADLYHSSITYNQSFLAFDDDEYWLDLYEYECVAPLKVYTKDTPIIVSDVYDKNNIITIFTNITNVNHQGYMSYLINGKIVKESNKIINKTVTENSYITTIINDTQKLDKLNLTIIYTSENYQMIMNYTVENEELKKTVLTINNSNTFYLNETVTLTGTLSSDKKLPNQNININVNGTQYLVKTDSNGNYNLTLKPIKIGEYKVNVSFNQTDTYAQSSIETVFNVLKWTTTIKLNQIETTIYYSTININGKLLNKNNEYLSNQTIKININKEVYTLNTDINGTYTLELISKTVGTNNITVNYDGNSLYNSSSVTSTFTVTKENVIVTYSISTSEYENMINIIGNFTTIKGRKISNSNVKILINDEKYYAKTNNQGFYNITLEITKTGTNNISIGYSGNINYNEYMSNTTFNSEKQLVIVTLNDITDMKYGENINISGKFLTITGKPITNSNVKIILNNLKYYARTNSNGEYSYLIKLNKLGINNLTVGYSGNDKYNEYTKSTTFNVEKQEVIVTYNQITKVFYGENITITGKFTDINGRVITNSNVKLILNGVKYYAKTDENGNYTISIKVTTIGVNNISIGYSGNEKYYSYESNITFQVVKQDVKVSYNKIQNVKLGSNITINGYFTDSNEKAISNSNVKIILNGVKYYAKTDTTGAYTFITTANTIGVNTLSIGYSGNDKYNSYESNTTFIVS